jgi:hypothetical protein
LSLALKLRQAAGGHPAHASLLLKANGTPWRPELSEHLQPFAEIAAAVGLSGVTMYALRHSSIVRQLLAGLPIRLTAVHHDTSVAMIEKTYSRHIGDHGDALIRRALPDFAQPATANVVPLGGRP